MKKKTIKISLKKILCFILAIVVIYYGGMMVRAATTPSTDIIFEDANLYKSLKERLPSSAVISSNDNTKTLSIANDSFTTITQLDLSGSSISNLSGIEHFTGLTSLNLSRNSISDISKLTALKSLTDLDLGNNTLSSMNDISNLTSLTTLKISSNRISNIEPIRSLTQLQTLDLSNNAISDAKAVQSLRNLTSLDISSNSSLANLSDVLMSQLEVLDVDSTAITDISGIENYGNLRQLTLSNNQITTLAPLFEEEEVANEDVCKLRGIEKLDISYTTKTGFSFSNLAGITELRELYAQGNGISSVRDIVDLEKLEYVNLNENAIKDISYFREETTKNGEKVIELIKATEISLANNQISDISVLGYLSQIDYLNLEGNQIANVSAIEKFDFGQSKLNLRNQTIQMSIFEKKNNENHYVILYDIMQSAKEPDSEVYDENAYFTTEGVTLNEEEIYNQSPYYNVIVTPDKTKDDTLSITLHGGVADGSKITFGISSSSSAVETLLFEDPNLDNAIYEYLYRKLIEEESDSYIARAPKIINITQREIKETKELDLSSSEIQNLKGLSNFSELVTLNISNNKISDDSEIKYLTKLETLNFANNQLNNHYSSIEKLLKLVNLDLSGNNIQDLNSLNNYLANLEAERDESELTNLTLANNKISDIQTLEKLSTLQVLNISSNDIENISYIGNNVNLNNLNISGNNIEDISVLSSLRNIKTLNMSSCGILKNIDALSNLSLTTLDISGNIIEDITPLGNQSGLEYLYMNDNKISDINSIESINLKGGLEVKRQKIAKILDDSTEGTIEIPLPEIFKSAKNASSKVYTATDFRLENCTLTGDGNSIQINTDELGDKVARVTIVGGNANDTTFSVVDGLKANITYNPPKENGKTKENVTATISFNRNATVLNNEGNTYTFTQNGDFKFIYQDEYGFSGEMTAAVDWIDNKGPQATVSYSIEEITNQNVEVTITADEKINNQVEGWAFTDINQTAMKKTYSSNTEEKVNIQDELGNNTEVTVSIKNIDKAAPTITGVENGKTYEQSVTPNITDDNLDTVTLTKDGTPVSNYTSGQAITANGQYVLTARDKAGNEESVEFTIAKTQLDDTITSSEYTVDSEAGLIDKISHDTTLSTFKNNISTEIGYKVTDTSGNEIEDTDLVGTGYKLTTDSGKEYTLIVTGDLNGDGKITMPDISIIKKAYLKIITLDNKYIKASDMNNDGQFTMSDISRIKKVYLGILQ